MDESLESKHDYAMDIAEQAFHLRAIGYPELSRFLFHRALEVEVDVATSYKIDQGTEPTRSILYRSAASLAYNFGDNQLALRLIGEAFRGNPPNEIREELIDLAREAIQSYRNQI